MKFLSIFIVLSLILSVNLTKLNFPRVLLPIFDKISINFTIEAHDGGCIKWSTSRQDLIALQPIYDDTKADDCSQRVLVTALSKERNRNTAIVLAEDLTSGEVLRCDVILDVIDQLGVLTTTRELYLEEAPETFELWAQDGKGNAFTTLEGVEFNWQIASENYQSIQAPEGDADSWRKVMKFLTFSESKYHDVPKSVERFEYLGMRGYMVLLEGINTGSARISVRLPYAEYNHVPTIEVDIMVLANLLLDPLDVHILPDDQVHFRVLQLKKGKLQEIQLNNQYYLEVEDTKYASIRGNTATGVAVGRTFVALRDRNIPISSDPHSLKAPLPKSSLTVTQPHRLTVNLLPYYNWVTVEGERHEIALDLYTEDDQKITLGTNYKIKSKFDTSLFYAIEATNNGTRIYGEAIRAGTSPVSGSFKQLEANAEMLIYKGIDIEPRLLIMPFDPSNLNRQKIQFKATGGDGAYAWSSTNPNIVHINQNGLAETRLENAKPYLADNNAAVFKLANVKVAMARNTKIAKQAQVLFLPPVKLEIVSYNFETPVHDYVRVHVALFARHNNTLMPFTSCEHLQFDVELSQSLLTLGVQQQFEQDTGERGSELLNGACRLYYLKAVEVGDTVLRISYNYMGTALRDEVSLFVFEKLRIYHPVANEIVLPIGASQNVFYVHGPSKLYTIESELQKRVNYDAKMVAVTEIENQFSKDKHVFEVLCRKVGTDSLTVETYNVLSTAGNKATPYVSTFVTKIYCVKPRFINLYTAQPLKASCPLERKSSMMQLATPNGGPADVDIEVLDVNHRRLANISSLLIEWDLAPVDEADVKWTQKAEVDLLDNFEVPKRDYLKTTPREMAANFKIHAVVKDYKSKVLKAYGIKAEVPQFGIQKLTNGPFVTPVIENELNFIAVNKTLLPFDRVSIYASIASVRRIPIGQGSGFYEIRMNDYSIVTAEFHESTKELLLTPKNIGEVRIEIVDRCLVGEPSFLYVSVVSQGRIEVQVPDRVERSKTIEAIVKMYDSNGEPMRLEEDLQFYELHEDVFNGNVLRVQLGGQQGLDIGEIRYVVAGMELGDTKVIFHSGHNEKLISSAAASIQVFPPLTLYPRNATIVVGSSLQIYSKGGPSPDTNIAYFIQKEDVISIDSSVALAHKLGHTKVTGRCVGINPATGSQIIFSEDSIHIHVVPLTGVQIKTPLTRLKTGAVVPASIWAKPDISPLVLGTLDALKVQWSTDQPDVVEINGIFDDVGVRYRDRDSIVVRLKALSPGKANIYAVVWTGNIKTTVSCEITVFKQLELEQPKRIVYDPILIPPKSSLQLKANLNDVAYELDSDAGAVLKVSKNGLLKSGDANGRTLVIATFNDQSLSIPVEVKNIHYIMASIHERTAKLKTVEDRIPQGLNLNLKITLHDNLGNEFSQSLDEINVLRHKSSHKEMLDLHFVGNFTVGLNLLRETTNMLSVYLKDNTGVKYSEDFIKIAVGQSPNNFPKKTSFTVGDVVCFESTLADPSTWSSSNQRVATVHPNTGVARILSGTPQTDEKVTITHGSASGAHINFDLDVRGADKLEFIKTYDIFNGATYRGYVIIKNSLQTDKFTNMIAKNVTQCAKLVDEFQVNLFACRLDVKQQPAMVNNKLLDHFKTYAIFDRNSGTYGCEIELLTSLNSIVELIKNADVSLELQAQLVSGHSATSTLKIVPGILVAPDSIGVDQLDKTRLVVSGLDKVLQKVEVKPSHPSAIEITQHSKVSGSLHYKVKLLSTYNVDDEVSVKIHSPATLQTIEVPILSSSTSRKCSSQPFYNVPNMFLNYVSNFGLLISALIVLAASVWVFVFCFPQKQKVITNGTGPYTSASPFLNDNPKKNVTSSPFSASSPKTPSYQGSPRYIDQSPNLSGFNSTGSDPLSPVYGGDTPQKRINRRYL